MKQQLKETVIYQPNEEVKVTVNNTPVTDMKTGQIFYKQVVTIRIENGWAEDKLKFANSTELQNYVDMIDWEDPQQELPL